MLQKKIIIKRRNTRYERHVEEGCTERREGIRKRIGGEESKKRW